MSSTGGTPPKNLSRAEKEALKAGRGSAGAVTSVAVQTLDQKIASKMATDVRQMASNSSADATKRALTRAEKEALKSATNKSRRVTEGHTMDERIESKGAEAVRNQTSSNAVRGSGAIKVLSRAEKEATKNRQAPGGGRGLSAPSNTLQALEEKVASKMARDVRQNTSGAHTELSRAEKETGKSGSSAGAATSPSSTLQALEQKVKSKMASDVRQVAAVASTTNEQKKTEESGKAPTSTDRKSEAKDTSKNFMNGSVGTSTSTKDSNDWDEEEGLVIAAQLVGDDNMMEELNRATMEELARQRVLEEMEVVTAKAEEVTDWKDGGTGKSKRRCRIAAVLIAIVAVAALVTTLATTLGRKKSVATPPIARKLQGLTLEDQLRFPLPLEDASPSERALQWMVQNSNDVDEENELELVQLFVMASLWFLSTDPFADSILDYCLWGEVSCDDDGHIVSARFDAHELLGTVPPDIGLLTELTTLSLQRNGRLEGSIPSQYGSLTNLKVLNLFSTQVHGILPSELGLLTNLTQLWLAGNRLSGQIPTEIVMMGMLRDVDLGENLLTGTIPTEIGIMTSLTQASLADNALQGTIPTEWGALPKLNSLLLGRNQLTGSIPSEMALLNTLEVLSLELNQLNDRVPSQLPSSLSILRLFGNMLSENIPSELGLLSSLEVLLLQRNNLSGNVPSEIGMMSGLASLLLEHNPQITGPLPDEVLSLTSLSELRLGNTSLTGPLSVLFENPSWSENLVELRLSDTLFEMPFPEAPTLSSLTLLYMNNMAVNGAIPTSLSRLTLLENLSMRSSGLTGTFPQEWGLLSNMDRFDISMNSITGTLPMELMSWSDVARLNLSGLNITGEFVFCMGENRNQDLFAADCDEIDCDCCQLCCNDPKEPFLVREDEFCPN